MSFPARLRELRTKKGESREDVAKIVSKSWHSIAKWETGKRDPSTDDLSLLADYFGVTTDYLLGKVDSPTDELVRETTEPLPPDAEVIAFRAGFGISEEYVNLLKKADSVIR